MARTAEESDQCGPLAGALEFTHEPIFDLHADGFAVGIPRPLIEVINLQVGGGAAPDASRAVGLNHTCSGGGHGLPTTPHKPAVETEEIIPPAKRGTVTPKALCL